MSAEDAQAVVRRYFDHLRDEEWDLASRLMERSYLGLFRETTIKRLAESPKEPATVEAFLKRDATLPRAVAEYFVQQQARHSRRSFPDVFPGVTSWDGLADLDDYSVFARHLEATDANARHRRHLDMLAQQHPEYKEQLTSMRLHMGDWELVSGSEVADRAYVLFQSPGALEGRVAGYEPVPHVVVLRRTEAGWRIAHDPSPYSGVAMHFAPVLVSDDTGRKVELALRGAT